MSAYGRHSTQGLPAKLEREERDPEVNPSFALYLQIALYVWSIRRKLLNNQKSQRGVSWGLAYDHANRLWWTKPPAARSRGVAGQKPLPPMAYGPHRWPWW